MNGKPLNCIVIGASQGGFEALKKVLAPLPVDFSVPILVVRHQCARSDGYVVQALNQICQLKVKFAEQRECPQPGTVYLAPPDLHLLVDKEGCLQLVHSDPVHFSRPAIDPLFESAAHCYGSRLLAVVLTGANSDGADGVVMVKKYNGRVLVQDPMTAEADVMPKAALAAVEADYIIWLDQIGPMLWTLTHKISA